MIVQSPTVLESQPLIEVRHLKVHFPVNRSLTGRPRAWVKAVDDISFSICKGETFSIVGESGCGKSTTGYALLGMLKPTAGELYFEGRPLESDDEEGRRMVRRQMQIVFQDPFASLNPKMCIGESIAEPLRAAGTPQEKIPGLVADLLDMVGLHRSYADRLPNQFSGGQRQRIVIARALAMQPKLIVCDEPVSALDVSIRSQILNLLLKLQQELGISYLFISHDLSVVRHLSDRVAVMYLGHIVELATAEELFTNTFHPYTKALFSAIPRIEPERKKAHRFILQGDLPTPLNPPRGCPLITRCPFRQSICDQSMPELQEIHPGHSVACFRAKEFGPFTSFSESFSEK